MSGPAATARRATTADARMLFLWRNDDATRRASRTTAPVSWQDHVAWLEAALASNDRVLLVVEVNGPVGTVRWDRLDEGGWELSITLAPAARGRGLAAAVLAAGESALAERNPSRFVAVVRVENEVAQHLFRSAGYEPLGEEDGMLTLVKSLEPQ